MGWHDLALRLRALFARRRAESELDEELSFHLAMEAEKNRTRGVDAREAALRARRAFGGVDYHREECRDARGLTLIENLMRDLRYGVRVLARTPVFTAVAVLSLAIGIGATTAVFSLVDVVLLRSLPVRHPEELVVLGMSANNGPRSLNSSYSNSGGGGSFWALAYQRVFLAGAAAGATQRCAGRGRRLLATAAPQRDRGRRFQAYRRCGGHRQLLQWVGRAHGLGPSADGG